MVTTHGLRVESDRLLETLQRESPLTVVIDRLASVWNDIHIIVPKCIQNGDGAMKLRHAMRADMLSYDETPPRLIFGHLSETADAIDRFESACPAFKLPQLRSSVQDFEDAFSQYLFKPDPRRRFQLTEAAHDVNAAVSVATELLFGVNESLSPSTSVDKDQAVLTVDLDIQLDLAGFGARLTFLNGLYEEVAMLLQLSVAEHPIHVRKIESGSLWVNIAGEAATVGILTSLLLRGARYLHRGFMVEGKLGLIPEQVDAEEPVFRLREQLRSAGIDTGPLDENIKNAGAKISQGLNGFLVGVPTVTVNDTTVSLDEEFRSLMIVETPDIDPDAAPEEAPARGDRPARGEAPARREELARGEEPALGKEPAHREEPALAAEPQIDLSQIDLSGQDD